MSFILDAFNGHNYRNKDLFTLNVAYWATIATFFIFVFFPSYVHFYIFDFLKNDPVEALCANWGMCIYRILFMQWWYEYIYVIGRLAFFATAIGLASALIIFLSLELDYIDPKDAQKTRLPFFIFFGILAPLIFITIVAGSIQDGSNVGFFSGLFMVIFMIIGGGLLHFLLSIISITSLICLPRAVLFLTKKSALRSAYEQGRYHQSYDAPTVVDGLNQPVKTATEARALRKDLHALDKEVREDLAAQQRRQNKLKAKIEEDTARKHAEAKIAENLAEVENLKIQNQRLQKFIEEGE